MMEKRLLITVDWLAREPILVLITARIEEGRPIGSMAVSSWMWLACESTKQMAASSGHSHSESGYCLLLLIPRKLASIEKIQNEWSLMLGVSCNVTSFHRIET